MARDLYMCTKCDGRFRLHTLIRPLDKTADGDLDLEAETFVRNDG
jgi:hypothetical protein